MNISRNSPEEIPASQLPDKDAEVLPSTQVGRKKVDKRQFLGLLGTAFAALVLPGCLFDESQTGLEDTLPLDTDSPSIETPKPIEPTETSASTPIETPQFLEFKLVHDVKVYGLGEKITSEDQIIKLYGSLDEKFAEEEGITIGNKVEQRKELLKANERYLEVVVRQSAYDSFIERQQETGVDFVEWIQMHVDAMNRCFENAKPPAEMESVLRRIVVISDDMPKTFSNKLKDVLNEALDMKWMRQFNDKYPIDTDGSWAIAKDYRVDTTKEISQGYFWKVWHEKIGEDEWTVFGYPPGAKIPDRTYVFSDRNDSIQDKEGRVWLDWGLIHEWSHRLWQLPDEYNLEVYDNVQRFQHFLFETGHFLEPYFSAYLVSFAKMNIERKMRNFFQEPRCYDFSDRPSEININVTIEGVDVDSIEVRRVRLKGNHPSADEKTFNETPDQESNGNSINLDESLFKGNSNCWLIKCELEKYENSQEIYFPAAALAMSTAADIDIANYNLEFSGYNYEHRKTQIVKLIDQSEIDKFLKNRKNKNDHYYAKMKVDGTDTWLVWFLRD